MWKSPGDELQRYFLATRTVGGGLHGSLPVLAGSKLFMTWGRLKVNHPGPLTSQERTALLRQAAMDLQRQLPPS